jgi:hypothetical protein
MTDEQGAHRSRPERQVVPITPEEALRRDVSDLVVQEDEEVILTPSRRESAKHFARVRLRRFEDLQALGLVPRHIEEQAVRTAIAADDDEALRIARDIIVRRPMDAGACHCHSQASEEAAPARFDQDLKNLYVRVRRAHHPALAKQLSAHFGTRFAFDSPFAGTVHHWTRRLEVRAVVELSMFQDITIGRGGKLVLSDDTTVLLARSIRIHRSGQLIHRGGFLRIWATSITSFLIELKDIVELDPEAVLWRMN